MVSKKKKLPEDRINLLKTTGFDLAPGFILARALSKWKFCPIQTLFIQELANINEAYLFEYYLLDAKASHCKFLQFIDLWVKGLVEQNFGEKVQASSTVLLLAGDN